jgi:SAM-dependent methyltransferase
MITRGDVQNRDTVSSPALVEEAIGLEKDKYSKSSIMKFFYDSLDITIDRVVGNNNIKQVLDVGSAIGEVVAKLAIARPELSFISIDIMEEAIEVAKNRYGHIKNIDFRNNDFIHDSINLQPDLILCLQTLEHIEDKSLLLFTTRLFELTDKAVILSVPREPFWCGANIVRLKYWRRLGNTPHHIQHWRKQSFVRFVSTIAREKWGESNVEITVLSPLKLWTLVSIVRI